MTAQDEAREALAKQTKAILHYAQIHPATAHLTVAEWLRTEDILVLGARAAGAEVRTERVGLRDLPAEQVVIRLPWRKVERGGAEAR